MNSGWNVDSPAGTALDAAFDQRHRYLTATAGARVGIFGNGFPEVLVAAADATPIHVNFGQQEVEADASSGIAGVIEPFVDHEVRLFLLRLMEGEFADYRGIIFARDDAPALIAYQYATEWVRQGRAFGKVPPLFLWNLVHTTGAAVRRFNAAQAVKLFDFLASVGLVRPDGPAIAAAAVIEQRRRGRLVTMEQTGAIPGSVAMRWRNAGRFMTAGDHARLLGEAMARLPAEDSDVTGRRIGLIGSPLASKAAYACFEQFGRLVADLQPWGRPWPGREASFDIDSILALNARDPFCLRATPANVHRRALVADIVAARCDLVICQLAQTDDTFGWEIPSLKAELAAAGIGFVNLGFRDAEPDRNWLDHAAGLIAAALEARP